MSLKQDSLTRIGLEHLARGATLAAAQAEMKAWRRFTASICRQEASRLTRQRQSMESLRADTPLQRHLDAEAQA